jgi:hypothetical protein
MVPYKGRYYNIRQYMKGKPVNFGIKVWAMASSHSRYVYLEAGDTCEEDELLGADVVLMAVRDSKGVGTLS